MQFFIDYRKAEKPLSLKNFTVEIGFGSGDYLLKLAQEHRDEIFFGIEKSWISINKLLKRCIKLNLSNVLCTRLDAYWAFKLLFRDCSVKRIIMNYPDPWFKKSHQERRLTKKENLYVFAKKLIPRGQIKIRTDEYSFVEFSLQEANALECFSVKVSKPLVTEPLTKYEKRWVSMGKEIWDLVLIKEKEPYPMPIVEIKEVKELFPVKIQPKELKIQDISNKEFKIEEGLYLKCFSVWQRNEDFVIETLISENNFLQAFMITIKKRQNYYIIDVSQFSEILKTEGVKKALIFLSEFLSKEER